MKRSRVNHKLWHKDYEANKAFCSACNREVTMSYDKGDDAYYCAVRVAASYKAEQERQKESYKAKSTNKEVRRQHRISAFKAKAMRGDCLVCGDNVKIYYVEAGRKIVCETRYEILKENSRLRESKRNLNERRNKMVKFRGVKVDDYETTYQRLIEEQGSGCAICGVKEVKLMMDHDHATGLVRGLLCRQHNVGLGMFQDNPDTLARAIEYLTK